MKKLIIGIILFFISIEYGYAEDKFIGTWANDSKSTIYEFYNDGQCKLIKNEDFSVHGTWKKINKRKDFVEILITLQTDTFGMYLELEGITNFYSKPPEILITGKRYLARVKKQR